jgi:hypothetical protein
MGYPPRNKVLVKPSGKLVIASAMFIARWHSAWSFWALRIDNLPRRLSRAAPCGDRWVREVSPCQSSRVARMTPSPQWGNSEWIGGMYDEPADDAGFF